MAGRTAHVSVKFVSEQISAVRDGNSEIIEGDATSVNEVVDYWTFARDTRHPIPTGRWSLPARRTEPSAFPTSPGFRRCCHGPSEAARPAGAIS